MLKLILEGFVPDDEKKMAARGRNYVDYNVTFINLLCTEIQIRPAQGNLPSGPAPLPHPPPL